MSVTTIASAVEIFDSRLQTLEHLLGQGAAHLGEGPGLLERRLIGDMHGLGTQVVFTCNQPHRFCLWAEGSPGVDLDPVVTTVEQARGHIHATRTKLRAVRANDALLSSPRRLELPGGLYADLSGREYLDDFLLPNFYFHLVTAYGILRMAGVPIGKRDFMLHLVPRVRQGAA